MANESRGISEFDLGGPLPATISTAMLSFVVRQPTEYGMSGCFDLNGCPPIYGLGLSFYSGNGMVEQGEFSDGTNFASLIPQPNYNQLVSLDVPLGYYPPNLAHQAEGWGMRNCLAIAILKFELHRYVRPGS